MLFSPFCIWELNCYKWKDRQVITTCKWKMYGIILFTYFIFISNNNWRLSCKKGVHGQFYVTDVTFRGQILGTKTLSYILLLSNFLFKIRTSIHHMVLNYLQKRHSDFILKSSQYFCFKLCYGHYKTRVSRHSDCWINNNDIKYCRTWIFLHFICLSYTLISRNAGWWDSIRFTN